MEGEPFMIPAPVASPFECPCILAIDPSLTATGFAFGRVAPTLGTFEPPRATGKGPARLVWLRDHIMEMAPAADLVVLEGYSYASKGRAIISLGELGGVLRVALHEAGVPLVEIAPSVRAKYATGKGNASKEEVLASAIRRLGYTGHDHNEADALWLWSMAADWSGFPPADLPKGHREVLSGIVWPLTAGARAA
jgi:crossover junction endodeoxyribonuclease RuvC